MSIDELSGGESPAAIASRYTQYRDEDKENATVRLVRGGSEATWKNAALELKRLLGGLEQNADEALDAYQAVASWALGALREVSSRQNHALEYLGKPLERCISLALSKADGVENTVLSRTCCRVLSNIVAGNETTASKFWDRRIRLEPENNLLSRLLCHQDSENRIAAMVLIRNATARSRARLTSLVESAGGRAMIARLLASVGGEVAEETEGSDDVFEIALQLVKSILEENLFATCFANQLGTERDNEVPSQQILLSLLDACLYKCQENQSFPTFRIESFLLEETARIRKIIESSEEVERIPHLILATRLLECLSALGLLMTSDRSSITSALSDIVAILHVCQSMKPNSASDPLARPVAGLQKACAEAIGVLCYQNVEKQDELRENGGLVALMGQCDLNDLEPTEIALKEYSMIAIAYALKDNRENQAFVAQLQPDFTFDERGQMVKNGTIGEL